MIESFYIVSADGRLDSPLSGDCVMALGSFDGVHVAHKAILNRAIELKESVGAALTGAWCFSELPTNVIGKKNIPMLCSLEEKISRILATGIDFVAVGDFSLLSGVAAEDFVDRLLIGELHCVGAVCGFNHRFGHLGLGTHGLLIDRFGEDHVGIVPEITMFDETVSSTAIRGHISGGEFDKAMAMLNQPVYLHAPVISGKHLGHALGFPTANQRFPENYIIPKKGIYATVCYTEDGRRHIGVSNVGIRPTITDGSDSHAINCETYICDFDECIYSQMLRVEFCKYLRQEQKFTSITDLQRQIARDAENAIAYFKDQGEAL